MGEEQDRKLMGGLFGRQGLMPVQPADTFRVEFLEAARAASESLGTKLIAPVLMKRVTALVAAYRASHPKTAKN